MQGVELRVAFRANSGGWAGSYRSEGSTADSKYFNGTFGWYGPAVDFFHSVQLEAGFTVLQVDVPEEAVAASGSSSPFTQCAFATGMGYVDVCIGDFSITSSRNEITPFYTVDNAGIWLWGRWLLWDRWIGATHLQRGPDRRARERGLGRAARGVAEIPAAIQPERATSADRLGVRAAVGQAAGTGIDVAPEGCEKRKKRGGKC